MKLELPPYLLRWFAHFRNTTVTGWHNPRRDWTLTLSLTLLLALLFLCGAGYLYWLAGQEAAADNPSPAAERFSEQQLQETLSYYEGKRAKFELVQTEKGRVPDPSR